MRAVKASLNDPEMNAEPRSSFRKSQSSFHYIRYSDFSNISIRQSEPRGYIRKLGLCQASERTAAILLLIQPEAHDAFYVD